MLKMFLGKFRQLGSVLRRIRGEVVVLGLGIISFIYGALMLAGSPSSVDISKGFTFVFLGIAVDSVTVFYLRMLR